MKKHLLFNQSFGTEASPNQTGETLTKENRIGLMSYLRRTLMLLFAVLVMSVANVGTAWGTAPITDGSSATAGASGTVTFSDWTSLSAETNYWKDGIKFWNWSSGTISSGTANFTTEVGFGYYSDITAGSGWGSYSMSGLVGMANFALGISVTTPSVIEIIVDNNQNNDLTLANLSIYADNTAYKANYDGNTFKSGTNIKSRAWITRVIDGKGRYKINIPVFASDLSGSNPYIVKLFEDNSSWSNPLFFVFESITVTPYIYLTDVKSSPESGPSVSQSSLAYNGTITTSHTGFSNWGTTSGASGYYLLTWSSALDLSSYKDLEADVWWGTNTTDSRGINLYVNGGSSLGQETDKTKTMLVHTKSLGVISSLSSLKIGGGDGGNSVFFRVGIRGTYSPCSAPSTVTVAPTAGIDGNYGWRYTTGETIDLTCTATGGSGDYSYQWQKYVNSAWTNIVGATSARYQKASCTYNDGGSYRCVVSTGEGCSKSSDEALGHGYYVRVFTLDGNYYGSAWNKNAITWTGENTGTVTLSLEESRTFEFKVRDNDQKEFGYTAGNYIIQPWSNDCGAGDETNIQLFTGPAGDYTITLNVEHANDVSAYVNVDVAYPSVTHPADGYVYLTKWSWDPYVHYWDGSGSALTADGSDPKINTYTEICEGNYYWYFPVLDNYVNFLVKDNTKESSATNKSGSQTTTSHSGMLLTNNGSWVWQNIGKTISFDANGGSGTMDDIEHICSRSNQTLPDNTFTRTGWTFTGWNTEKHGKGTAYAAGDDIDITEDITLYAQWERTVYLKSDLSWWYDKNGDDDAWFSIYYWDSSDDSNKGWVEMELADCETNVYKATLPGNGYNNIIFVRKTTDQDLDWDNVNNQSVNISYPTTNPKYTITSQISGGGDDGKVAGSWGAYTPPAQYTISFAGNGNSGGSMSAIEDICEETDQDLTANAYTKTGYDFASWKNSVALTYVAYGDDDDGTHEVAAAVNGTVPDKAKIKAVGSDITMTARWKAQKYDITYRDKSDVAFSGTHEKNQPTIHTYNSETTLKLAFKAGYEFGGWYTSSDCSTGLVTTIGATDQTASFKLYAKWTAMNLDALEGGTLYTPSDMVPSGITVSSSAQYYPGVSANNRFNILGVGNTNTTTGPLYSKTCTKNTIDDIDFTESLYSQQAATISSSLPTDHALQFKISSTGLLDIYCYDPVEMYLIEEEGSAVQLDASETGEAKITKTVSAGTYYIYTDDTDNATRLYGLKFTPTYSVTYKKNGGASGTDGSVTGSVPTDATAYMSGDSVVVKAPGDLALTNKTFIGWNTAYDGSGTYVSPGARVKMTGDISLYALWRTASSCPGDAGGTVFALTMKTNTNSNKDLDLGESVLLGTTYATTLTNGNVAFTDVATRTGDDRNTVKAKLQKGGSEKKDKIYFGGNDAMLTIYLDCALKEGDEITFTTSDSRELSFTTTPSYNNSVYTSSQSYTIPNASTLVGKKIIYVWRKTSNSFSVTDISITRPAVKYDVNIASLTYGEITAEPEEQAEGEDVTITVTPDTGYELDGDVSVTGDTSGDAVVLTDNGDGTYTFEMPEEDVTASASFTAKTYTVTLNGNGGSGNTASVTATYNSSDLSSSITNPTKSGYIFCGWYSGTGGTGSLIISKTGVLQASVAGYTGAGGIWTKDDGTTLYAKWATALPATLDKSNYTAVSDGLPWYGANEDYFDIGPEDAPNTSSYVEWDTYLIPCSYSVSTKGYYPNGHQWQITLKNTEKSYTLGKTWAEGDQTENGASAWDLSDLDAGVYTVRVMNLMDHGRPKIKSLTLNASIYTATYDANGGTCGTESETVCGGSEVTLPSALGDGAFEGWYDASSAGTKIGGTGDSYEPTADITLYAHWGASCPTPNAPTDFDLSSSTMTTATFAITDDENAASYDLYYASGSPSTPTSETTATQSVTTKTPTITGLTASTEYKIWVRSVCDASHKSAWVALDAEGGAFTTPAPETYTITYNTDGAAEDQISDGEKTEGTNFTLSSTRYTKAGYRHVGWATSQGGSKVYDFGGTYSTDADLALYPAWVKLAVYNPDMSTEAKLTATIDAEFGGVDRWTLTTDANLVSTPKNVSSTAEENLTGEKYGLAFTPSWGSSAKYDLGAQTTLYQLTLDLVMGGNGSITALLQDGSSNVVKTLTDDIAINGFTAWEKKTFTYTYDAGVSNVRYIRIYGNGVYVVGLTRIKAEYAPTKTEIVLDSQSATSDGTTSVTATYGASTNLTSDITAPTKTNYIFGGYYTEESGAGTQLIDENGAWLASKTGYTDGSKNWQYANPDLTLYAKWTAKTTPTKYNVTAETIGSCNEASVTIILEDSEDGVIYELYKDGSATGTTKTGTGEALNWSGITAAGEYTIWTVEDETYASVQMDNDGYTTVTVIVKDDAELAYDDDEIEKNVGDAAFTNTLTNSHSVSVTYESSDEDVATVETDGEVTIVGAGSTTITASFAGDATYCAASVSYTLTVYPVYTVTYIAMGGSCSPTSANTTTDLGKVTLPSASHDDYSSYTWVTSDGTEAGAAGDEYEPSGNITLYAKWSGSCASTCYTVTYHGNGATSGYVNDPVQYASGTTVYVSSSTGSYTRDGYEFNGWNTAANGSGTKVAYFTITGNTTLYAQWKYVINSNNTDFSGYAAAPTQYQDVKVTNGATLTITSTRTIHDLTIETGSTLNVSTTNGDGTGDGVTFTVNSLHLKGGWNSNYTKYDIPRVYIDRLSSLVKDAENPIVNFDISVDSRTYYPFAVPFRVKVSDINYADPTLAYYAQYGATGQYVIKEYDGERRAEKGPDHENNWKVVPQEDKEGNDVYLEPGRGYIMTAISLPAYGGGVIRIPLSFTNDWTALGEQGTVSAVTKNIVPVTAYTGKATEGDKFANKGWNLLGVPFMSCYTTSDDMGTSVVMQGKFNFETGEWDGEDKVRYVNVPMHDFSEYVQVDMEDEKTPTVLRPGWCFFVQIGTTGNLTFLTADQAASSSLPIYAPKREKANMPTVKTGIILSDGEKSDQTTFLVSDKYSAMDYEINADLEKLFGNGYTLATYSLSGETRLAYNALSNADVANIIPIGYRAPAEGEYTFSINPSYAENGAFESVNLIDYETGIVTNLSQSSYTFSTERTQNDVRFALNVVPRQETPTDLEDVQGDDVQGARVRKLLIEDKLFIIRDGVMYDATGKKVKGGAQ